MLLPGFRMPGVGGDPGWGFFVLVGGLQLRVPGVEEVRGRSSPSRPISLGTDVRRPPCFPVEPGALELAGTACGVPRRLRSDCHRHAASSLAVNMTNGCTQIRLRDSRCDSFSCGSFSRTTSKCFVLKRKTRPSVWHLHLTPAEMTAINPTFRRGEAVTNVFMFSGSHWRL